MQVKFNYEGNVMRKYIILTAMFLLSGCSTWNNLTENWSWNALNPWADREEESVKAKEAKSKVELPANVNKYLWQASLEKLSFMGIVSQNSKEGRITTNWISLSAAPGEKFKIVAEINSGELRADALNVKVYKEINGENGWIKSLPSSTFESEIEQAVIERAKVLYISDKE